MNETEAKPKKSTTTRWLLIGAVAVLLAPIAQCSIAATKGPVRTPLTLSNDEAAGNCIGELQLEYKANGMHIVGRMEDFSVTSKTDLRMDLDGKVILVDLSTGGSTRYVSCVVARAKDGSTQTSVTVK